MSKKNKNNRVLISFLGTGPLEKKQDGEQEQEKREYKRALYRLDNTDLGEFPFVASALQKHYSIDKILLVGTVHSMWEEVYRWFSEARNEEFQEDTYLEIASHCEKTNHLSPLEIPHKEKIEQALGSGSHVVLIKYGITEAEMRENINIILGLQDLLNDGDELIVDVTHSFRSLPISLMNLLIYLQNVSPKRIKISHIHYGMLELTRELGYAPIVDLKPMMETNDWIIGAYNFMEFGNAYKLAGLLRQDKTGNYEKMADLLVKFSDQKNLNSLRGLNMDMDRINNLVNQQDSLSRLGRMIIPDVIDEYNKTFNRQEDDDIFRWRMAKWHYDRKNYGYAFVNLVEAALSYCCYMLGRNDVWDRQLRGCIRDIMYKASNNLDMDADTESLCEELKNEMQQADVVFESFVEHYFYTNRDRNNIAHELDHGMRKYETEMSDLDKAIKYFDKVIRDRNRRKKLQPIPLFINFSNHPSSGWGEDQLLAAKALGEVADIPFPMVKPDATPKEIDELASECVEAILNRGNGRPLVVHVMGEMTLSHAVVMLLQGYVNVSCVASTTERIVTEVDGKKVSEFHFVQFREY